MHRRLVGQLEVDEEAHAALLTMPSELGFSMSDMPSGSISL
jgi:hypothetical protein